jgi:hypothetical protein
MPVYSAAIQHTFLGQAVVNVIGMARTDTLGGETVVEAGVVAEQVAIAWKQRLMPLLANGLRFDQVEARGMVVPEVVGKSFSPGVGGGLGSGVAILPSFAAVKVVFLTNTPGRAGRGRTGISGLAETYTEVSAGNNLVPSTQTSFQNAMINFINDLAALTPTIFPVVISRFKGVGGDGKPLPRPGGPIASAVVSTSVQSQLGTRVSRLR